VGFVLCIERISRYIKEKHYRGFRNLNYATVGEFLSDLKEEFSRRDDKIIKDGRIKEDRARKQDNRGVLLQSQDLRVG